MSFFGNFFSFGHTIQCPRCLGKGHVDLEDIKRLNQQLRWIPDTCAYCKGKGKVNQRMLDKVAVDTAYLTTALSSKERRLLINKDEAILEKARQIDDRIDQMVHEIIYLHYACNVDSTNIAEFYLLHVAKELHESGSYESEKGDMLDYVRKVILLKGKSELN